MDKENQAPEEQSQESQEVEATQVKAPSTEEQARAMGWKPLEEYSGDPSKWVEANVFVARAPLFEKIEQDKRKYQKQLDELNQTVKQLAEHNKKTEEAAYKRALAELKAQQKAAIADGDTEKAFDLQEQLDELKENRPKPVVQPVQQQGVDPDFVQWVSDNSWYEKDGDLRQAADRLGMLLATQGVPKEEIFKEVAETIKLRFPDKFKTVKAPPVTESPRGGKSTGKDTFKMTPDEERIMEKFVSKGVITREKYIADLKAQRGQ